MSLTTGNLIVVSLFLPVTIRAKETCTDDQPPFKSYLSETDQSYDERLRVHTAPDLRNETDTGAISPGVPDEKELPLAFNNNPKVPVLNTGRERSESIEPVGRQPSLSSSSSSSKLPRPLREVADRPLTPTRPVMPVNKDLLQFLPTTESNRRTVANEHEPKVSTPVSPIPLSPNNLTNVASKTGYSDLEKPGFGRSMSYGNMPRPAYFLSSTPNSPMADRNHTASTTADYDQARAMTTAIPKTNLRDTSAPLNQRVPSPSVTAERSFSFHTSTLRNGGLHNALLSASARLPRRTLIGTLGVPADHLTEGERSRIDHELAEDGEQERRWGTVKVVWTDSAQMHGHYDQFCKQVLWPMFHYVLPEYPKSQGWEADAWQKCLRVHEQFLEAVVAVYKPGDVIWINDYHLMLLPAMIRKRLPDASIGFFLHVPFPSSEIFRCLHVRKEILEGLLGANLIGFQTYSFARHFIQTCSRVLRVETTPASIELDNHAVQVGIFPIGSIINITIFSKHPHVTEIVNVLKERYAGKKIIVSRDKLDYVKGVRQKLIGFEKFLEMYPDWCGKAVLIQIALSTTEHNELNAQVSDVVARINSRYGSIAYQPVVYLRQDIAFEHYLGLLTAADAFMITSIREGMNLTSHEFVCCQAAKRSPLIISEFAGTYGSFGAAIRVNPWDYKEMAEAIYEALVMDEEERTVRWQELYRHVTTNTAQYWVESFVGELNRTHCDFKRRKSVRIPQVGDGRLQAEYIMAKKRLSIPKNTNVLTPLPECSAALLDRLTTDPKNHVFIVSGRTTTDLQEIFANVSNVSLCAENGCYMRLRGESTWKCLLPEEDEDSIWRAKIREIFAYYTERTPGSFIEEKQAAIVWHYRAAENPSYGAWQAAECQNHLQDSLGCVLPVHVAVGNKAIEVSYLMIIRHYLLNM
ncbi:glycosyltransferase family 20-domain-containing protein [Syncephalis fuscata]|nr:glycosyltransferase family 20-domain-containing protein [Syncephalis fuscata]